MGLKRPREETRCALGADVTRHKNLKLQGEGGAGLSYGRIVHTNGAGVLGHLEAGGTYPRPVDSGKLHFQERYTGHLENQS